LNDELQQSFASYDYVRSCAVKLSLVIRCSVYAPFKKFQSALPFPVRSFSSNFLLAASTISSLLLFSNVCRSALFALHPPFSFGTAAAISISPSALVPFTTPASEFPASSIVDAVKAVSEDEVRLDVKLYRVMRSVYRGFGCGGGAATPCNELDADEEANSDCGRKFGGGYGASQFCVHSTNASCHMRPQRIVRVTTYQQGKRKIGVREEQGLRSYQAQPPIPEYSLCSGLHAPSIPLQIPLNIPSTQLWEHSCYRFHLF